MLDDQIGETAQHAVAALVAEAVIDRLEMIEIDHRQRQLPVTALGARPLDLQALLGCPTVGEAGKLIFAAESRQLVALGLEQVLLLAQLRGALRHHRLQLPIVAGLAAATQTDQNDDCKHGRRQIGEEHGGPQVPGCRNLEGPLKRRDLSMGIARFDIQFVFAGGQVAEFALGRAAPWRPLFLKAHEPMAITRTVGPIESRRSERKVQGKALPRQLDRHIAGGQRQCAVGRARRDHVQAQGRTLTPARAHVDPVQRFRSADPRLRVAFRVDHVELDVRQPAQVGVEIMPARAVAQIGHAHPLPVLVHGRRPKDIFWPLYKQRAAAAGRSEQAAQIFGGLDATARAQAPDPFATSEQTLTR